MASGPVDDQRSASLPAERDDLARRCARAEQQVQELTAEVTALRARVAELEAGGASLSLFDDAASEPVGAGAAGDGSDPRVLSFVLGATAVVAALVALLALVNDNLSTPFGITMVVAAVALAYAAARTRVRPVQVTVTRGVVLVTRGESTHRFDLRSPATRVEMVGSPGDAYWQVRFHRKGLDPVVIDPDHVDPHDFVRRLREHRPDL